MRLRAFAGFAALGAAAADNFEDDDLNFLRALSTNSTGNATTVAPTTVAAGNATTAPATTVASGNATTAPATTVASGNATTAPATTVAVTATTTAGPSATTVAAGASNATTVAASVTEGATTAGSTGQVVETTAPPAVTVTALCSAAAYESVGLTAPATFLDTMADFALKVHCSNGDIVNKEGDQSTLFYKRGSQATTAANLAKCAEPATVTQYKCGGQNTLEYWKNEGNVYEKQGMLMKCCGVAPGFTAPTLANVKSVGTVKWENFTDSACTTLSTATITWPMSDIIPANPTTFTLGECKDLRGADPGLHIEFASCNTTHYMQYNFYDAACDEFASAHMSALGCAPGREVNGTTTAWTKWSCTAEPPADKTFSTTLKVDFTGLAGLTATQVTAVKTTYEAKSLDTFTTALGNSAATITPTHTYSGALASRRRLSGAIRRLSGTGGVTSVFVTTLPAAAADTAQAAIVTATTGASALSPTAFKSTIETELSTNTATSAFASNITAAVTAPVVTATAPAPTTTPGGGSSSTSGAMANLLGFGSALLMATCLLM